MTGFTCRHESMRTPHRIRKFKLHPPRRHKTSARRLAL